MALSDKIFQNSGDQSYIGRVVKRDESKNNRDSFLEQILIKVEKRPKLDFSLFFLILFTLISR